VRATLATWALAPVLVACAAAEAAPGPLAALGAAWLRGGDHVVVDGARQVGALVVSGGEVRLAPGSRTDGPVVLLGGALTIDGLVSGDVVATGGALTLGPWAAVHGDVAAGAAFARHPDALVSGRVRAEEGWPRALAFLSHSPWRVPLQAVAAALVAALWARAWPRRLAAMADVAARRPARAALLGAVAAVGAVALAALAAAALAHLPVRPPVGAVVVAAVVAAAFLLTSAWGVVGTAVARRLGRGPLRGLEERTVLLAAIGGFDVALVLGLVERLPWVGGPVVAAVTAVGVGALLGPSLGRARGPRPEEGRASGDGAAAAPSTLGRA
jgi:hypothetical protein